MQRHSLPILLTGVSFLIVVGIVMLVSTCAFSAQASSDDAYREAKRQAVWLLLGSGVCVWASLKDYRFWKRGVWWFYGGAALLLALCFVPGIGMEINGERRWIGYSAFQLQPSEFAKIVVVVCVAYWFSRYPDAGQRFGRGFLAPLTLAGALIALVLFEVDIGTTAVLAGTVFVMLFVAGVDWRYLTGLTGASVAGFIAMMSYAPDRVTRLMAFLDPEAHKLGAGFQQWISLMAIGSGGLTGRGIGEGRLKMLYMPFAHTDFIFPMIGEELGLIFTTLVVIGFIFLCVAGMSIAFHAADRFGALLATGLTTYLVLQAFLNIGVTTAILPNTGLPLPFISYGGSSLVFSLAAVGILINIWRQGVRAEKDRRDLMTARRFTPRP